MSFSRTTVPDCSEFDGHRPIGDADPGGLKPPIQIIRAFMIQAFMGHGRVRSLP